MPDNDAHEALLHEIIVCELAMFLAVPNADGPSTCQERPQTFRLMRWMSLSVHDDSTLTSYLNDLKQAGMQGRNLMVEKYARMEDSLPPLTDNPLVDVITGEEAERRMRAQQADGFYASRSDYVLDNTASVTDADLDDMLAALGCGDQGDGS